MRSLNATTSVGTHGLVGENSFAPNFLCVLSSVFARFFPISLKSCNFEHIFRSHPVHWAYILALFKGRLTNLNYV